jgi:glycosyltransferase involved in cell wall biosynthesis
MTADLSNVSVIIAAFADERWPSTMAAIQSARSQSAPPFEVIVCIDHNADLLEKARAYAVERPGLVVVDNTHARGVSGARNCGASRARGSVLVFLDDDAEAASDWLATLCRGYVDPHVLGVGGQIEPMWMASRPDWFPEEFLWVVGCSYRGLPDQLAPTRNLIGANMSFRSDVFEAVGGFREDIGRVGRHPPVGCEDTALCIRACELWPNGKFLYEPRARVRHRVPDNRGKWQYFVRRCYAEGSSKAHLAQLFGLTTSLAVERAFVTRTLPAGLATAMVDTLVHRQTAGLARGGAMVCGLVSASAGFIVTAATRRPLAAAPLAAELVH